MIFCARPSRVLRIPVGSLERWRGTRACARVAYFACVNAFMFRCVLATVHGPPRRIGPRFAMTERKRKLTQLGSLRRRTPHCSQSALDKIIQHLKQTGLPDLHNRRDMREARDAHITERTPYGPISRDIELVKARPGKSPQRMLIAHPLAMLWQAYNKCAPLFVSSFTSV